MNRRVSAMLAGASLLAILPAVSAHAQSTAAPPPADQSAAATSADDGVIVVNARRKDETLKDVPLTDTVVPSAEVTKLNLLTFSDLTNVVSGLQLNGSGGFQASLSARGVTFGASSAASPTVATYINDAPTLANELLQNIFDVGQFEVLKGPQGTLHGISAPSGAITLTTKRPDLHEIGGTFLGDITDLNAYNLQGAVGVPIIPGVLAVRLAGLRDVTDGNGVRSANSGGDPTVVSDAFRASLRFDPVDNLDVNLMWQHLRRKDSGFGSALFGPGHQTGTLNPSQGNGVTAAYQSPPTNYNGPPLTTSQNLAVADAMNDSFTNVDLVTGTVDWHVLGQKLSYVQSWQYLNLFSNPGGDTDGANLLPGIALGSTGFAHQPDKVSTYELRLASEERIAGIFDYVVGAYHSQDNANILIDQGSNYTAGAFGSPLAPPVIMAPNPHFGLIHAIITTDSSTTQWSWFGNVTAHIGNKFEVSGGLRWINSRVNRFTDIRTTPGFSSAVIPANFCAGAGGTFGAIYAGVCDIPVAVRVVQSATTPSDDNPFIYDVSASYHFTPDVMVYAHVGSAWRQGPFSVGITNGRNDPTLNALQFLSPEKSTSYEAGLKWTFFNERAHVFVDYYHQDYNGLIYTGLPVSYLSDNGATAPTVTSFQFITNVPAKVDGFDIDIGAQVTPRWSFSGKFSWANGRLTNALIPCQDGNFDGTPDGIVPTVAQFQAAHVFVARCQSSASSTIAPKWNFNIQSEYDQPINDSMQGFIRGLFAYQPKNPNASVNYVVPAYGLLNLYLGIRDAKGRWELSAYAKNLTDNKTITSESAAQIQSGGGIGAFFGTSGYLSYSLVERREFGMSLRYSFGPG